MRLDSKLHYSKIVLLNPCATESKIFWTLKRKLSQNFVETTRQAFWFTSIEIPIHSQHKTKQHGIVELGFLNNFPNLLAFQKDQSKQKKCLKQNEQPFQLILLLIIPVTKRFIEALNSSSKKENTPYLTVITLASCQSKKSSNEPANKRLEFWVTILSSQQTCCCLQ